MHPIDRAGSRIILTFIVFLDTALKGLAKNYGDRDLKKRFKIIKSERH
jgi:hypothetical protein